MTIIYQYKVATTSFFGFFKLLKCWRGSVYKMIYKELFVFCLLYGVISLVYRFALTKEQQQLFASISTYCNSYTNLIPVSFVLGFYVSIVVHRWWQQFTNVPWPDRTLFIMGSYIQGEDERSRIIRRTVARYMLFGEILILRSISVAVMKRYPSLDHIVDAGIITYDEALLYERVECKYNKFWVPLVWANSVLTNARREGKIESDIGFRLIVEQLADFRDKCSLCFVYDWITIPLVYTQVVTLACHMFFAACLIGRQYVNQEIDGYPDLYIPVFTLLQFFFYMGWLKVAEQLINPFGEDDDDFDLNWLIDRHAAVAICLVDQCHAHPALVKDRLQIVQINSGQYRSMIRLNVLCSLILIYTVAMCLVDQCHGAHPPLVKDAHFNEMMPDLPYTAASMSSKRPNFLGSTYNLAPPSRADQKIISEKRLMEIAVHGHGSGYKYNNNNRPTLGSRTGSMLSLFGFKSNLQKSHMTDSRDTLMSAANGYLNIPPYITHNGGNYTQGYRGLKRHSEPDTDEDGLPEYVPLRRARASTDATADSFHQPLRRLVDNERERKWSFPLSLIRRKHDKHEERTPMSSKNSSVTSLDSRVSGTGEFMPLIPQQTPSRAPSRFTIEPVQGDVDADTKYNRNKQIIDMHLASMASANRPSRPPVLSAIEEGNTIRSISEMIGSTQSLNVTSSPTSDVSNSPCDTIQETPDGRPDTFISFLTTDVSSSPCDTIQETPVGRPDTFVPCMTPDVSNSPCDTMQETPGTLSDTSIPSMTSDVSNSPCDTMQETPDGRPDDKRSSDDPN